MRTLLTASCLLVFGVTAASSQPTGHLSGVVRDTMGSVLPGVEVSVTSVGWGHSANSVSRTGKADTRSMRCPPGDTRSRRRSAGFNRTRQRVDIEAGRATLDLVLVRLAGPRKGDGDRHEDRRRRYPNDAHCRHRASGQDARTAGGPDGRRPRRFRADADRLAAHRTGAGDHPRHRHELRDPRCRSQLHDSPRRRLSRHAPRWCPWIF